MAAAARALFLGGGSVLLPLLLALVDGSGAAARGAARRAHVFAVVAALLTVGGTNAIALPRGRLLIGELLLIREVEVLSMLSS